MRPISLVWLRRIALLIIAAVGIYSTGCVPQSPQSLDNAAEVPANVTPAPRQVTIDNFTFTPATVTIAPGTTVTWINHDDVPHTVTADDRLFASEAMDTNETFSRTFTAPGTYPYFCAIHHHMTGQIIVK